MKRKEGVKTGEKVVVEKPQENVSRKLVIGGNNSTVRIVTPPLVLNKNSTGTSSTRFMIGQGVVDVETRVIWKPHIVMGEVITYSRVIVG